MAFFVAAYGIAAFIKTILAPPVEPYLPNQFKIELENDISEMTNTTSLEDAYAVIYFELLFQKKEGCFTAEEFDSVSDKFFTTYTPMFRRECWNSFALHDWDTAQLNAMIKRVSKLKELYHSNTTGHLDCYKHSHCIAQLDTIANIVKNYFFADSLSKTVMYTTIEGVQKRLERANVLKRMNPLCNCDSLVQRLDSLPYLVEEEHYKRLEYAVYKLKEENIVRYYPKNKKRVCYQDYENTLKDLNEYVSFVENNYLYPSRNLYDAQYLLYQLEEDRERIISYTK